MGNCIPQLLAQMPEITDEQYIKELISVTADYETSIITIMVAGDIDNTQQMIDTIRTGMETVYSKASDTIAEHKLTKISDSVYTVVDLELAVQQQENFNRIYESSKQLQDKMVELKELEDEGEPQWEYSWWSIVKQLVKYLVIAASLGLLAAVLAIAAYYITSDKILDVDKLQAYSNISILGVIPRKESKPAKMKNGTGAIQQHANSSDSMMTLTAQSIYTTVLASGAADGSIALAGSLGRKFCRASLTRLIKPFQIRGFGLFRPVIRCGILLPLKRFPQQRRSFSLRNRAYRGVQMSLKKMPVYLPGANRYWVPYCWMRTLNRE